jgi:DNA helicase HerA-like ATPase
MSRADHRRALGKIVAVSANDFTVELSSTADSFTLVGFDGQHYVARIGSFVLIPLQTEYVVAEVVGLRERELSSGEQLQSDIQDAQSLRAIKFLDVVPLGSLPFRSHEAFRFGVSVYPPLYSDVLYTQTEDLDRILEVSGAEEVIEDGGSSVSSRLRAFDIGTSVVFENYKVKVKVDEFFGGHSAILGNTGSGKSCTVAAIVQSVFEKQSANSAIGASFIFFDTNGEYRQAFAKLPAPIGRLYATVPGYDNDAPDPTSTDIREIAVKFRLPHWFMSSDEWEMLLRASDRTQRPILRTALGLTSLFADAEPELALLKNHILASAIFTILASSESPTASHGRIQGLLSSFSTDELSRTTLARAMQFDFGKFVQPDLLPDTLRPFLQEEVVLPDYRNLPFKFESLGKALDLAILYEESHGNRHIRDYTSSLMTRFKSIATRREFQFLRPDPTNLANHERHPNAFVELLVGLQARGAVGGFMKRTQITILDMNEVEDEIVEVVAAVVTRLVFERLRRSAGRNALPVNLVLEEAHRYISDTPTEFAMNASKIFERVAKEGRKYGLFITLASQRPSELSKTVLSQCSNFVVHRIQNPEDLQHVRRMTPFISDAVLSRLPSLPKQHALIFGNSVSVPTTFKVRDASPTPRSDDAKIRHVWFVNDASVVEL